MSLIQAKVYNYKLLKCVGDSFFYGRWISKYFRKAGFNPVKHGQSLQLDKNTNLCSNWLNNSI